MSCDAAEVWAVPERFGRIYAHAVETTATQRLLFLSGQVGVAPDGSLAEGFEAQCRQAMRNVEALLQRAGMSAADMVKVSYLLTDAVDLPLLTSLRNELWASANPPAVTVMVVAALANPRFRVEIEAVAAGRP